MWCYGHRVRSCALEGKRENPEKVVRGEGRLIKKIVLKLCKDHVNSVVFWLLTSFSLLIFSLLQGVFMQLENYLVSL